MHIAQVKINKEKGYTVFRYIRKIMGKEIYIDKPAFRAYFGKCFDEILLGDRPYGLKQATENKKQQVLHTYIKSTVETDPETQQRKTVHKRAGYYTEEDVSVKTGKLTDEQKLQLKKQFLQLAYDCVAKNAMSNKLYNDLTYNPSGSNPLPIEAYYKSVYSAGNVVVENDYNEDAKKYWQKVGKTKDPSKSFKVEPEKMDMFYSTGEKIRESSGDYVQFSPNYKHRENIAKNLVFTWQSIKKEVYGGKSIFDTDEYFSSLYNAVLDNMEKEDRELIEKEFPNFGVTEEEKELFLDRNQELKEHFENLDPALAGNRYVEKIYPETKKDVVFHATDMLEKYFSETINAKSEKDAKEAYEKELPAFVDRLLNAPNEKNSDFMDISRLRYEFNIDKKKISDEKAVNDFIKTVHDKVMPTIVLSQGMKDLFGKTEKEPITSINLNKLICSSRVPSEVKFVVSQVATSVAKKAENLKEIYNTFILPNIKNGSLDMKKMQQLWLDVASKMDKPVLETDSKALQVIKGRKDLYKDLTEFNGEKKEQGAEFNSNEAKIEWRNQEVMNLLKESIDYYAPKEIKEQVEQSERFGMKPADYRKLMHKGMRGREVASDALNRIKSLNEKTFVGKENPYRLSNKDEQGFIVVDEDAKADYLGRCCAEINALKESYNQRSFWYHIAFWRAKPEKEAILQIENSLKRNGYTKEEIQKGFNSLKDKTNTDGPFDYKQNKFLLEEEKYIPEKENVVVDVSPEIDKEAPDLSLEEGKKLVEQILPNSHVKVVDPILGNVSEMYGVILNGEKNELQSSFLLEELAKDKLDGPQQNKEYTEKDVELWEDPLTTTNESMDAELEELFQHEEYDPDAPENEEDLENSMQIEDLENIKK